MMKGEVWKEYDEVRRAAALHRMMAADALDIIYEGEAKAEDAVACAQVEATLAVAGRLECLCYILTKVDK